MRLRASCWANAKQTCTQKLLRAIFEPGSWRRMLEPAEEGGTLAMRRKGWMFGLALTVVAGAGTAVAVSRMRASAGSEPRGQRADAKEERPVVVASERVVRADVPIDLEGIGSVAAYKTVMVRPQVDGRLDSVSFTEGQEVKRGQLLAQIDPRPFLIQLHQAEGNLARDQSLLTGSQLNLQRYEKLTEQKFVGKQQVDGTRGQLGQYQGAVQYDQA